MSIRAMLNSEDGFADCASVKVFKNEKQIYLGSKGDLLISNIGNLEFNKFEVKTDSLIFYITDNE